MASLDPNSGKLVWAMNHDIQTVSLKGISKSSDIELVDGERVTLNARDLGACEVYPQQLSHNSNGSFIVICGDGEYIIYTSQALRNKAFGSALEFVWSSLASGDYAIRESVSRVKIFKNFKESKTVSLPISSADGIYGGHVLAVKGPDCVVFFDWEEGTFIRKIDVTPLALYWSDAGDTVIIACQDTFYVLHYNKEVVDAALSSSNGINPEEGVDGSFELITTINERIHTGQWVGECFLYTNNNRKLNYIVGGEIMTLCHLTTPSYLLGFVPKEDRVFVIDKTYNVVSYKLLLSVLSYQTAVVRKDFVTANALLPMIPTSEHSAVARFLESQGFKQEALAVTTDNEHKFELSVDLKRLDIAHKVMLEIDAAAPEGEKGDFLSAGGSGSIDLQSKWRRLGDLALANGQIALAELCAKKSGDLSGLLLLYSSAGNKEALIELGRQARESGRLNVAFVSLFITGRVDEALELLVDAGRFPEAAFFARSYLPSQISRILKLWKSDLKHVNEKAAEALADPAEYPNLFPDYHIALVVEQMFLANRDKYVPASLYPSAKADLDLNLIELVRGQVIAQQEAEAAAKAAAAAAEKKALEEAKIREEEARLAAEMNKASITPTPASPPRSAPSSSAASAPVSPVPTPVAAPPTVAAPSSPSPAPSPVATPVASPQKSPVPAAVSPAPVAASPAPVKKSRSNDSFEDFDNPPAPAPVAKAASTPSSPVKTAPPPTPAAAEEDEDLELDDDLDLNGDDAGDDGKDVLENDDFEEDW